MSPAGWSISSSPELRRRALLRALPLLAPLASVLGGCGFRPLYADAPRGAASNTAPGDLAATRVGLIADREGQLLRRELVNRLGSDRGVPAQYQLTVRMQLRREQIAVQQDQTETRSRITATAEYVVTSLTPPGEMVTRGRALAVDAFNVGTDQYFAAQLSGEAARQRIVERLAEDITGQLAAFYARRRSAAAQPS